MISIRNLLFLAVAVTGSVIKRDANAAALKKDLQTINTDTQAVTAAAKKYNGGGIAATGPIMGAQQKLKADLQTATKNAKGGKVSEAEADDIINYITGQLEPSIVSCLSAVKEKKEKFAKDGLTGAVTFILQSLKSDSSSYSDALIASAPASRGEKAKGVKNEINAKFDDAIKAFS